MRCSLAGRRNQTRTCLRHFRYANEEFVFKRLTFRYIASAPAPTAFVQSMSQLADEFISDIHGELPSDETDRAQLFEIVKPDVGQRLLKLFYAHIWPAFPVLSKARHSNIQQIPTYLLACIYALSLPFRIHDEVLCVDVYSTLSDVDLYRLSWRQLQSEIHRPKLGAIQTCLLLCQRRASNEFAADTPFTSGVVAQTVKLATVLGLHLDPTQWRLPPWEIRLRRRLWFCVWVVDIWNAVTTGTPRLIRDDDVNVRSLTPEDFHEAEQPHDFLQLAKISTVLADILQRLFTIKALTRLADDMEATLEICRPLMAALQQLEAGTQYEGGRFINPPNLRLCHLAAELLLFRAILRPTKVSTPFSPLEGALLARRDGAKACCRSAIELVASLRLQEYQSFWYSWSRFIFAIISSFQMLVFVTATSTDEALECKDLVHRWRRELRVHATAFKIMTLGVLRLDAMFWVGLDRLIMLSPEASAALSTPGARSGLSAAHELCDHRHLLQKV